ncbi:H(+)/Cl(-) exchange transporter ClcA [Sulfurimonas sp.]
MKSEKYKFFIIIFLSVLIGISVGLIVSLFHLSINWVVMNKFTLIHTIYPWQNFQYIAYMFSSSIMLFISVYLVKKYAPDAGGSGIQNIEGVVANKITMNDIKIIIVKFFGGVFSLGAGMAMGREGPSVQIGGAVGQMLSRRFSLNRNEINMLVAAGAGAGLATTFNAPLAGILFVFEEMRDEMKYTYVSVQSIVSATVVSIITLHIFIGNNISIPVGNIRLPDVYQFWIFIIFGLFFGVFGFIFNKYLVYFTEKIAQMHGWQFNILILIIGSMVGLLLYFYPNSVGEGYGVIHAAINNELGIEMLFILFTVRFLTTLISYGTGAPGGIFAPMLALGTLFGVLFGILVNISIPSVQIEPLVFAIVGMSAFFSATVRAPLTGIILVAEMTSSFNLLMPLLITSLVATITVNSLGGRAIYTILLEEALKISKFGKNKSEANEEF